MAAVKPVVLLEPYNAQIPSQQGFWSPTALGLNGLSQINGNTTTKVIACVGFQEFHAEIDVSAGPWAFNLNIVDPLDTVVPSTLGAAIALPNLAVGHTRQVWGARSGVAGTTAIVYAYLQMSFTNNSGVTATITVELFASA